MQNPKTPNANAQLDRSIFLSGFNCTSHRENSLGIYEYDSLEAIKFLEILLRRVKHNTFDEILKKISITSSIFSYNTKLYQKCRTLSNLTKACVIFFKLLPIKCF